MASREDLSDVQLMVLGLLALPSGLLSLAASFTIIVLAWRSHFSPYKRIMIGLSISDILLTTNILTGQLFVPESSIILPFEGNEATCNFTGFNSLITLFTNSFYSGLLAVYFFCTIRFGWSPSRFARAVEPGVHIFIVTFAIVVAAIPVGLRAFQKTTTGSGCFVTIEHAGIYVVSLAFISLTCVVIFAANLSIYLHVKSLTKKSLRRSMNPSTAIKRKQLVTTQSFCYVAAYAVTYTPGFIMGVQDLTRSQWLLRSTTAFFVFDALLRILMPFTGFLNLMVFLRPHYLQFREQYPAASKCRCLHLSLTNAYIGTRRQRTERRLQQADPIQASRQLSVIENISIAEKESNGELDVAIGEGCTNPTDRSDTDLY